MNWMREVNEQMKREVLFGECEVETCPEVCDLITEYASLTGAKTADLPIGELWAFAKWMRGRYMDQHGDRKDVGA